MVFAATKTSDGVVLRIHAQGEIPVSRVTEYLNALEEKSPKEGSIEKLRLEKLNALRTLTECNIKENESLLDRFRFGEEES